MNRARKLYEQMSQWDYTPIIQTAVRECGVKSEERAKQLLKAFLQWFALIPQTTQERPIHMLRSVDRIWHAMVLNTAFYRQFCLEFAGRFVDHNPLDVVNDSKTKREYADHTLSLITQAYGRNVHPELLNLREDVTCCIGCGNVDLDQDVPAGVEFLHASPTRSVLPAIC